MTEEDDLISEGRLFHKNTILLKYAFLKRKIFCTGLTKITRDRASGVLERIGNDLVDVKLVPAGFTFIKEHDVSYFMPV